MAEQQTIKYVPQWNNMTVDNVIFQSNNVLGNFNYPPNVPTYKPIMIFLRKCPLYKAFTNCPSVVYQNFLKEFWSTTVAFDPFPSTDKPEKRPLKEFLIKFSVSNGKRPLTLDFKTFCSSTGLDYNNDKYVDHPTPEDKKFGFLPPILSNSNFTKDPSKVTEIELTVHMIDVNNQRDSMSSPLLVGKPKKGKSYTVTSTSPKSQGPGASGELSKKSKRPTSKKPPTKTKSSPPHEDKHTSSIAPHNEASDINSSSDKILKKITEDQWEEHKEAVIHYVNLEASIYDYHNENIAHRDQTDKLVEAFMSSLENTTLQSMIFTKTTEILSSVRSFDFYTLQSTVKNIQDHTFKQEEASSARMKSSTNMAWNLGSRISGLERAQTHIKSSMFSLQEDTISNKSMMTEMYNAFTDKHEYTPTLLINLSTTKVKTSSRSPYEDLRDMALHDLFQYCVVATLTHSELTGSTREGKGIATDDQSKDQRKLVNASSIVRPDPDEPIRVEFMINWKIFYLTKQEIQEYWDKEEEIKKAEEKARLNAISKTEDAKHEVLKRQHTEKVRKSLELRKHKYDSYMWTVNSRLKPKPITDIKIHQKAKPVVITVYRGTASRNFVVHKPFLFESFGISELDELGKSFQKRKMQCQALLENVSFINNMVIEEPEYGIFFTNEFGDQAFQRWSDIDKVGMEALVSYLVAAFMVKSPENARFSMKLRKLIAEHPDQKKLKSKKVKLEALGYKIE
uniref:Uncharacterized protein n=1 Tax=Tanacetum cinerariifolium TaxID=118510 RepID=A0A6L2JQH0_TANCI|nr:hypothetical protein [Tanacetum cinerariifolium]